MRSHLLCVSLLVLSFTGCGTPTPPPVPTDPGTTTGANPTTVALIQSATAKTVSVGLAFYATKNAEEAKKVAAQIQSIVATTVLPYLNGATGLSSSVVDAVLKQNFINLPGLAKDVIALAATLLDSYIPAPSEVLMSAANVAYMKAFFNGLNQGCADFLAGRVTVNRGETIEFKKGRWLAL